MDMEIGKEEEKLKNEKNTKVQKKGTGNIEQVKEKQEIQKAKRGNRG